MENVKKRSDYNQGYVCEVRCKYNDYLQKILAESGTSI